MLLTLSVNKEQLDCEYQYFGMAFLSIEAGFWKNKFLSRMPIKDFVFFSKGVESQ